MKKKSINKKAVKKKSVLDKKEKRKKHFFNKVDKKQMIWIVSIIALVLLAYIFLRVIPQQGYSHTETKKGDIISCADSDSGLNYFLQGSLKVNYDSGNTEFIADSCLNPGNLIENFCESNSKRSVEQNCEFGCFEGACLSQADDSEIFIDEFLATECGEVYFTTPKNAFSSSDHGKFSALDTLDFDADTHWFGDVEEPYPKWILFDLGERKCISEADIYIFKRDLPTTFDLQVSNDQVRWKTIGENITLTEITNAGIEFPATTLARYIRIYQTSGVRPFGTLSEIRVGLSDFPEDFLNG
jgi:hypothetical protein